MRKYALMIALALSVTGTSFAQDAPRAEIFAGYSYVNFDTRGLTNRLSLNGWEASAVFNLNSWLGVEGDFSGHYVGNCAGVSSVTCKDLSFMGGPKITFRTGRISVFGHGLFGGDNGSISALGASVSDTPFSLAAGGGADFKLTDRFSIRVAQVDYFLTRHANSLGAPSQNNIRASAGIVFTFGGNGRTATVRTPRNQSGPVESAPINRESHTGTYEHSAEAPLLGVEGYETSSGFKITAIKPESPAAQTPLRPGDVIVKIDGREVHNNYEIESAIAASSSRKLTVDCLIQTTSMGLVASEYQIKIH